MAILSSLTDMERETLSQAIDSLPETLAEYITRTAPQHSRPIPKHLATLVDLLERSLTDRTYALVSMPPRFAKSTTVRRALAWAIKRHPDRLNFLVMYAADAAKQQARMVRAMVREENVPLAPDSQSTHICLTTSGGGLISTGIHGQLTGKGCGGLLILDDPTKGRAVAESRTERDKAWDMFRADAWTRLQNPIGSCIILSTRWHVDDLHGRILEEMGQGGFPKFEVINLPAINKDGTSLWPSEFPIDKLERTQAVLGQYDWNALYLGQPIPRGGQVFGDPVRYVTTDRTGMRIVLAVDAAGTEGTRSDYTAVVALGIKGNGPTAVIDILDAARWQLEPKDCAKPLYEFQERQGGSLMLIEASRDGKALHRALKLIEPRLHIWACPPIGDKFTRAQPAAAAWNAGRVRVPLFAPWLRDLLYETSQFTGIADRHDDFVDCISLGCGYLLKQPYDTKVATTGTPRGNVLG